MFRMFTVLLSHMLCAQMVIPESDMSTLDKVDASSFNVTTYKAAFTKQVYSSMVELLACSPYASSLFYEYLMACPMLPSGFGHQAGVGDLSPCKTCNEKDRRKG